MPCHQPLKPASEFFQAWQDPTVRQDDDVLGMHKGERSQEAPWLQSAWGSHMKNPRESYLKPAQECEALAPGAHAGER